MALGAVTKPAGSWADYDVANKRIRIRDVVLTTGANYTTGGETITLAQAGMRVRISHVRGAVARLTADGSTCRTLGFAYQTDGTVKMQVYTTASAEAAGNSDQSTFTARLEFEGY